MNVKIPVLDLIECVRHYTVVAWGQGNSWSVEPARKLLPNCPRQSQQLFCYTPSNQWHVIAESDVTGQQSLKQSSITVPI